MNAACWPAALPASTGSWSAYTIASSGWRCCRVGVGKSSLVNALVGEERMATDVAHGCTRHQQAVTWPQPIEGLQRVELVDTPGIDEVSAAARGRLAARVALQSDLVLLVLDADISRVELEALETLVASGKPVLTVLNRSDCWSDEERNLLVASIGRRVKAHCGALAGQGLREPLAVAAAPRQATQLQDGRVRSARQSPRIALLRDKLQELLTLRAPPCSPSMHCDKPNGCSTRSNRHA